MMTVNEVSKLTGVSVRALQYYDSLGLLCPDGHTDSGYRLYDEGALEKLQQILLYRELEFPLKEIREILDAPSFDKNTALSQQIELLTLRKEHLEDLIEFARKIQKSEVEKMDFTAFDTKNIEEYEERAKKQWGSTPEYMEYYEKSKNWSDGDKKAMAEDFMKIFAEFGDMKEKDPSDESVQRQVEKLQDYISNHYYNCSNEILLSLGTMYSDGGDFTENIDKAGGKGTADFVTKAIEIFCK